MDTLQSRTFRTTSAFGRLADLQRRADRLPETPAAVTKSALHELTKALEELRVANEELQALVQELSASRLEAAESSRLMDEFANAVPTPVIWTDWSGVITKANEQASRLLNIGRGHLIGKPLMLFVTDREALFGALRTVSDRESAPAVDVDVTVRPRERRPRTMTLCARRLERDGRCVWFVHEPVPPVSLLG
jgi:two-component system cell cycle sensor histidine kinase/response regulator CckA